VLPTTPRAWTDPHPSPGCTGPQACPRRLRADQAPDRIPTAAGRLRGNIESPTGDVAVDPGQCDAFASGAACTAMAAWYPLILLLLSCAIVSVGAVAFEVLVLESFHRHFDHATMERIEAAVMARVRRFMPFVVALLFLSGFALFDIRCNGLACIGSRFGWLLSI